MLGGDRGHRYLPADWLTPQLPDITLLTRG
jgi:hypothetical protein